MHYSSFALNGLGILILSSLMACSSLQLPNFQTNGEAYRQRQIQSTSSEKVEVIEQAQIENTQMDGEEASFLRPELDWPVDRARFSRGFLPNKNPRPHLGLDLAARRGTPIYAAQTGKVIFAGTGFSGYGRFIIIESDGDWATFYGHLQTIKTRVGEIVQRGQEIGTMGDSGRATGVHLHFELRYAKKAVDPIKFLPANHIANN